jgi:hypothetical protein
LCLRQVVKCRAAQATVGSGDGGEFDSF